MSKTFRERLLETLITLFIGLSATIAAVLLISIIRKTFEPQTKPENKQLQVIEKNTQDIKKSITPYETKEKMTKAVLVQNFSNTTRNGEPTNVFSKQFLSTGLFNNGYLYIKASIDNQPLDNKGDVYTKLTTVVEGNYQEYGGHLQQSKSLERPKNTEFTELLYPLSDIKYKRDYQDSDIEILSGDWLKILNMGGNPTLITFTSTAGMGKIIELTIYYECVSGSSCEIKSL